MGDGLLILIASIIVIDTTAVILSLRQESDCFFGDVRCRGFFFSVPPIWSPLRGQSELWTDF